MKLGRKTGGELMPCRFCGGKASYFTPMTNWTHRNAVICEKGHAIVIGSTRQEAIDTWNGRVPTIDCSKAEREVKRLESDDASLRDLAHRMAQALRVGSGWCDVDCARTFKCSDLVECPIEVAMSELGIEVD